MLHPHKTGGVYVAEAGDKLERDVKLAAFEGGVEGVPGVRVAAETALREEPPKKGPALDGRE